MTKVHVPNGMDLGVMMSQCVNDSTRWFPGEAQSLQNLVLCLAGEVGEVANLVKKIVRGSLELEEAMDPEAMSELEKDTLQEEIVDVLIYLCNLMGAKEFKDVDWEELWRAKRDFNQQRFGITVTTAPMDEADYHYEKGRLL